MAQNGRQESAGKPSDFSLALLSDSELYALAQRELHDSVKPELLPMLDRSNLVMLLLAHRRADGQSQGSDDPVAPTTATPALPTAAAASSSAAGPVKNAVDKTTAPPALPVSAAASSSAAGAALPRAAVPAALERTPPAARTNSRHISSASTAPAETSRNTLAAKKSGTLGTLSAWRGQGRQTSTSSSAKKNSEVALAATSMWCTLAKLDGKARKEENPAMTQPPGQAADKAKPDDKAGQLETSGKMQPPGQESRREDEEAAQALHGTTGQKGEVPEAGKTAEDVDAKHSSTEAEEPQFFTCKPPPTNARGTSESKVASKPSTRRDLKTYMAPEPVEQALARKCKAIKTSSAAVASSLQAPVTVDVETETAQEATGSSSSGPKSYLKRLRPPGDKGEMLAKTVKTSKVGRPRKDASAAALPEDEQQQPQVRPLKRGRPSQKDRAPATKEDSADANQSSEGAAPSTESAEKKQTSPSKIRLACHIDPAKITNASVCEVLGSLNGGKSKIEVLPGDLLLAAAGAHPRWELDASLSTWMKDRLRPSSKQLPETWALKPHQQEGVLWLLSRSASRFGCILADDMGLGKTRQAIAWMLGVRLSLEASSTGSAPPDTGPQIDQPARLPEPPSNVSAAPSPAKACQWSPFSLPAACGTRGCGQPGCTPVRWERALVLAPSMLVRGEDSVWIKELTEVLDVWGVHMRVWQWHGERSGELRSIAYTAQWSGPLVELYDVVIISYESFLLNHEEFCKESWTCVVLDEAQSIKNHGAQIAAATKKLSCVPFRLAMTGSPIENSLEDFHSILEFVQPDCAGTVQDFRQRFPPTPEGQASLRRLSQLLALRRESSVAVSMVPREEVEVAVQMTDVQRCLSEKLVEKDDTSSFKRLKDLELLCTHPWCYAQRASSVMQTAIPERFLGDAAEQSIADSSKLQELFGILRGLLGQREKVLIFFCRVITSDLVAALVHKEFGIEPGIIRGDTSSAEREKRIREFKADPDSGADYSQVLLLSVKVGALGLNLPEARWVVHIERVWNPALERQATSRVHRITSRLPVKAYCLFTEDSVEERKRAVLLHKRGLSSGIFEVLDGDQEDEDEAVFGSTEVRELISGVTKLTTSFDEDSANAIVEEGEGEDIESDIERSKCEDDKGTLYPLHDALKSKFKDLKPGKYGDPKDQQLWNWYAVEGRREVHARALQSSTAGLIKKEASKNHVTTIHASRLSSRPCRLHDPKEREDWQVTLDIKGEKCRLFIPESQRHHFTQDAGGQLRLRPPSEGAAPFPIFMPSSGRSASDPEVGLLDLTTTMLGTDGKPLDFVQIVAVKPAEVEKYRASAPFFIVMELPSSHVVEHPCYGKLRPDDLGVGCSRHWLVLLADVLGVDHIVMLDDSVRAWYGTTFIGDAHSPFGLTPGPKAQFTRIGLGQVLQYFTPAHFPPEEFQKFSVIGFARFCPEMYLCKFPHQRAHVFSAFLLNVQKVFREQHLNFREELYVWEDAEFTKRAQNVCKSFRFAMVKKPFRSGGCTNYIARSENPIVRCVKNLDKLSASEIAAEALAESGNGISAKGASQQHMSLRRGFKKRQARSMRKADAAAAEGAAEVSGPSAAELAGRTQFELENDPALQQEGAVCNAEGYLLRAYYKRFIQAFKDKEKSRADPAAPRRDGLRPGLRSEEEVPQGLRPWDDTVSVRRRKTAPEFWGAGWVADHPYKKGTGKVGKAVWFNVRVWGSWRLAFFLARLQRHCWMARCSPDKEDAVPSAAADSAGAASSAGSERKTPVKSGKRAAPRPVLEEGGASEKKRSRKKDPQSTLFSFFGELPKPVKAEPAPQPTILNFFGKPKVVAEEPSDAAVQIEKSTPALEPSSLTSADALQKDA